MLPSRHQPSWVLLSNDQNKWELCIGQTYNSSTKYHSLKLELCFIVAAKWLDKMMKSPVGWPLREGSTHTALQHVRQPVNIFLITFKLYWWLPQIPRRSLQLFEQLCWGGAECCTLAHSCTLSCWAVENILLLTSSSLGIFTNCTWQFFFLGVKSNFSHRAAARGD